MNSIVSLSIPVTVSFLVFVAMIHISIKLVALDIPRSLLTVIYCVAIICVKALLIMASTPVTILTKRARSAMVRTLVVTLNLMNHYVL